MNNELSVYSQAKKALQLAVTVDEIKEIRDKSLAMAAYAKQAKDKQLTAYANEIRARAERKAGGLLIEMPKQQPGDYKKLNGTILEPLEIPKTLEELGVTKKESMAWQSIAKISDYDFEDKVITSISEGDLSINQVYNELKKARKETKKAKEKEVYEQKINNEKKTTNKVDIFKVAEKFRVIYADPPWSYNDKQDTHKLGGAQKHYFTMSIKELCELPVKNITEENAILFLWVTSPLLEESFQVINEWGFKYKTSFIWDKIKHNMGHYNSVRHEFLLICTKGSCTPDNKNLYDSVISVEKSEHSKKPMEFINIIDDLYSYGNRLELFAREEKKENWFVWGNEV